MNERPLDGFLEQIAAQAPLITNPGQFQENQAWLYGLDLVDAGFYWEAHEVLEPVWFNATPNSRERFVVQGLIQFANAALKKSMGREQAACRLVEIAVNHLNAAARDGDDLMGITISQYLQECKKVISKT